MPSPRRDAGGCVGTVTVNTMRRALSQETFQEAESKGLDGCSVRGEASRDTVTHRVLALTAVSTADC